MKALTQKTQIVKPEAEQKALRSIEEALGEVARIEKKTKPEKPMPFFVEEVYSNLPKVLSNACKPYRGRERDNFLLGSFTAISSTMKNVSGLYRNRRYHPHLMCFISAPAASGKGVLSNAKELVLPIHQKLREEYESDLEAYEYNLEKWQQANKNARGEKPSEPDRKTLFIPANVSCAAVLEHLKTNGGNGLLFSTEADTINNTFSQDWGDYSDVLRKCAEHESVESSRTSTGIIEVENPMLSCLLSGTPTQAFRLLQSSENGLVSRFLFYTYGEIAPFDDPFADNFDLRADAKKNAPIISNLYEELSNLNVEFDFTDSQKAAFCGYFEYRHAETTAIWGNSTDASIKRLGVSMFRLAMQLAVLRAYESGHIPQKITCTDIDYELAQSIAATCSEHLIAVLKALPGDKATSTMPELTRNFFLALPSSFETAEAVNIAAKLNIPSRTAKRHLSEFCELKIITNMKHGHYYK